MRRSIWIVSIVVFGLTASRILPPPTAAGKQDTRPGPARQPDETLIANERALLSAVAKADKAAFLSLVIPEGAWTTAQGFVPMNLLVNGLEAFHLSKWEVVNPRVTRIGEDSAVVLYAWRVAGTYGGQPLPPTTLSSTVWVHRGGKWLAVHHQDTELRTN